MSVYIEPEAMKNIESLAKEKGITPGDEVVTFVNEYYKKVEAGKIRKEVIGKETEKKNKIKVE